MKQYKASDLFFYSWKELKPAVHAQVYALQQQMPSPRSPLPQGEGAGGEGYILIAILRLLRKRPLLVDKINVEQAVDIYNDMTFLNEPWYFFPHVSSDVRTPDEKMARTSFDQFIWADNEFTSYIATGDEKHLARLAATIYPLYSDEYFDPETVEDRAAGVLHLKGVGHLLHLIFYTFAHVRTFVVNRCRHLLPKGGSDEAVRPSGPMWHQIKHQAARTLVFGNFESLGRSNMYNVLDHLELLARENTTRQPATSNL